MMINVELLVGRRVLDRDGRNAGRLEEILVADTEEGTVVREYHVGAAAFFEHFSLHHFGAQLTRLAGAHGRSPKVHRVPWQKMDLSDPEHPRLTCRIEELE